MRAVLAILGKDLRLRARDRSAFIIGIAAPLGLAFILNAVIGGGFDDFSARFGVVDQDGGEIAGGFVAALEQLDAVDIEVTTGLSDAEARHHVDDEQLDAAFVIPEGFSAEMVSPDGAAAEIQVIGNVNAEIGTQIATAIAEDFAGRLDAVRLSVATASTGAQTDGADGADLDALVEAASEQEAPVQVSELAAGDRTLDDSTYLMAGMSIMFLFLLVQFGVTGLLEEEQNGTLARLRVAPVHRLAIPLAKGLVSVVLGLVSLSVLVIASTAFLGASWGDPLAVAALMVAAVLAAVSIIGIVAALARTAEQAGNFAAMVALVLAIVGGSFFRVAQGEGLFTRLAALTPHHWFLRGLGEGSEGGLVAALPAVGVLLAFAIVVGAVGACGLLIRRSAGS